MDFLDDGHGQLLAAANAIINPVLPVPIVGPLIEMLQSAEAQVNEMPAFALEDTHSQAGIAHGGGIAPLLKLLDSRNSTLQYNGAFALYGLADNEDTIADLIRVGGVQKLLGGEFILQPTRECSKVVKKVGGKDSRKGVEALVIPNFE